MARGTKRQKKDDFFEDDDDDVEFADASDEGASSEDDFENQETAEEKRLRLAKSYLDRIQQVNDDEEGEDLTERLHRDALESMGHLKRLIADQIIVPSDQSSARHYRCHKLAVAAVALTSDDSTVYSVSKDGSIVELDVESGKRTRFTAATAATSTSTTAPWMAPTARKGGRNSLLAAAVSTDGSYLAVAGGSKAVHIYDTRSRTCVKSFKGHKDEVTALAFRQGTHQLFSASLDRAVNIWSLDDMAYVDTLFGHQSPIVGLDALQGDRALSCGSGDRTCRLWKVPEESQLVFRANHVNLESCAFITQGEWITGDGMGNVQLWNTAKKKPTFTARNAHVADSSDLDGSAGSVGGDVCRWVGAVTACPGSDLLASGAGDGIIRLWKVSDGGRGDGGRRALEDVGAVPVRGFVNSLAIARSARFLVAGIGQEPRMGRWLRDPKARNGVFIHQLDLEDE